MEKVESARQLTGGRAGRPANDESSVRMRVRTLCTYIYINRRDSRPLPGLDSCTAQLLFAGSIQDRLGSFAAIEYLAANCLPRPDLALCPNQLSARRTGRHSINVGSRPACNTIVFRASSPRLAEPSRPRAAGHCIIAAHPPPPRALSRAPQSQPYASDVTANAPRAWLIQPSESGVVQICPARIVRQSACWCSRAAVWGVRIQ